MVDGGNELVKRLKLKPALVISGIYLLLFYILMIVVIADPSTEMIGLSILFFTMPWSILMLSVLEGILPSSSILFFIVTVFSALINAAILYFLVTLLGMAYRWFNKTFKVSDE